MDKIPEHLLGHFLWWLIGITVGLVGSALYRIYPGHRTWRLTKPSNMRVCVSTSIATDTGAYVRPATGMGQVKALALLASHLRRSYHDVNLESIYWSSEQLHDRLEGDLILLGGPKNNPITRHALDLLKGECGVDQEGSRIIWTHGGKVEEFQPTEANHEVTVDYGLIVRTRNPFASSRKSTLCVFTGGHTYGTAAAASYFTKSLWRDVVRWRWWHRSVVALVRCDVISSAPTNIRLVHQHSF